MKQRKTLRVAITLGPPSYNGRSGGEKKNKPLRVYVVLEGEDDRILGGLESALSDGLNHILQDTKTR